MPLFTEPRHWFEYVCLKWSVDWEDAWLDIPTYYLAITDFDPYIDIPFHCKPYDPFLDAFFK